MMLLVGGGIALVAAHFGARFSTSDTVATLAAMMVATGFLGAVSVGCMNQIFSTLTDDQFANYLVEEKAFDQFLAWPQITLLIQMTYLFCCAAAITFVCAYDWNLGRIFALCEFSALTLYVTNKTWCLIDLLRILAWHRQDFVRLLRDALEERSKH
ncbi:MAG: hypothetical protein WCA78_04580 [Rhizomicrobium sp.]